MQWIYGVGQRPKMSTVSHKGINFAKCYPFFQIFNIRLGSKLIIRYCTLYTHMFLSLSSITWYRQKCGINRHTTRCTSPVSMVSQLLSGCRNGDQHQHNMLVCAHMALEGLYIFSFGRKNVPKCKSEGQKMK